ncbi:hypothetical protein [Sphingobacterium sp. LRF_L2]
MHVFVEKIRKELQTLGTAEGQAAIQRFHKEEVKTYGISIYAFWKLLNFE